MSVDLNKLLMDVPDNERSGARALLPASCYPVVIAYGGTTPSAQKGTPTIELLLTVTDGPYRGAEVSQYDSRLFFTCNTEHKNFERNAPSTLGLFKHMTHQVTGKYPDMNVVLTEFGFETTATDGKQLAVAFWTWLAGRDDETRCKVAERLLCLKAWDGKACVADIGQDEEVEKNALGEPVIDEATGKPVIRKRNRVVNLYGPRHEKYGVAQLKAVHFVAQAAAKAGNATTGAVAPGA